MGRELGEGEIRVKRVVLTALRAWLAVVINKYVAKRFLFFAREVKSDLNALSNSMEPPTPLPSQPIECAVNLHGITLLSSQ